MKILYVHGDDYAALHFEEGYNTNTIVEMMEEQNATHIVLDDAEDYTEVELLEFGNVDSEFIDFVRNRIQDYDDSKHANFYVVEE